MRELPDHDSYFRPRRAEELRVRAAGLERWLRRLPLFGWAGALLLLGAMILAEHQRSSRSLFLLYVLCMGSVALLRWSLAREARIYREVAARLDQEHEARYGPAVRSAPQ